MKDNKLKLIIPIPPSINNDYMKSRAFIVKQGSKSYAKSMMYESNVAKKFKKEMVKLIKEEVLSQGFDREDRFTRIDYIFFFPRINMDTNNYYKCFIDSITDTKGLIWEDDNISLNRDKRIYYDSKNPRVEVEIYYEEHIGIFDNQNMLEVFIEDNCNNCKKGLKIGQKGGCSIYKKALENRIQEDVEMDYDSGLHKCLKLKTK